MAQFQPGQSGNPKGRPRRSGTPEDLRKAIEARAVEIINSLIESAIEGDTQAARVLLDRIMPAWKAQDPPAHLPPGIGMGSLADAPGTVLQGLASGHLDIDQAGKLAAVLSGLARVTETTELIERITRLEEKANGKP